MAGRVTETQVAVIGAGPAGLCAAIEAARTGADVVVLDEKPAAGGQLFKQIHKFFGSEDHMAGRRGFRIGESLLEECERLRVRTLLNSAVWGLYRNGRLGVFVRAGGTPDPDRSYDRACRRERSRRTCRYRAG
jgi:NADPH-dependent 2,4-dienoyl-CoA reductase/sulfur reductase-like enzyme